MIKGERIYIAKRDGSFLKKFAWTRLILRMRFGDFSVWTKSEKTPSKQGDKGLEGFSAWTNTKPILRGFDNS